jgi:hypothetical protein
MNQMQRGYLKFVAFILTALALTCFQSAYSQNYSAALKTADSLYQQKRYTQSFEHYQQLLKNKKYSPAMLLKMAYIQEGLKNIGQALYYLNLYFLATNDKAALEKMEELADQYNLEGYKTSDTDRALTFYHDYYNYISYALAALILLLLTIIVYTRRKLQQRPIAGVIFISVFIIAFFIHVNYGRSLQTGIITRANTFIMDGPSPGASLVVIVGDGHRVEVIGKKDVWFKIRWNGEVAYVKQNALLPIQL